MYFPGFSLLCHFSVFMPSSSSAPFHFSLFLFTLCIWVLSSPLTVTKAKKRLIEVFIYLFIYYFCFNAHFDKCQQSKFEVVLSVMPASVWLAFHETNTKQTLQNLHNTEVFAKSTIFVNAENIPNMIHFWGLCHIKTDKNVTFNVPSCLQLLCL